MPDSQPLSFSADAIVDTVREPMLVLSADLRVRRANRSFYRTFRVTPEETVDRLVYDLGNQQWDIPWLRKLLEEVLPQDTAFDDFEVEHVFPAIGRKFMLLNARRICGKDNQTEFILLAIEDTTERRQAEEAKREIESRYTSLVQNIKDHSIFMMDLEGNITTWNAEAEKIIGYAEAEILGRNFSVIFTAEDLQAGMSKEELRLAREDGRAEDERWHVRKDGSRFWALGIVTPMHDARGKLTGFSKILRDMTDRKRAEEALQEADRHKDEFLATLAHELRNPMVPLRNGLQLLRLDDRAGGTGAGPCDDGAAVGPDGAAGGRPPRHQPHQPQQAGTPQGPHRIVGGGPERRRDGPPADRGERPHADSHAAPVAGLSRRRPDPAGAGVLEPLEQQRQVHGTGRAHQPDGHRAGDRGGGDGRGHGDRDSRRGVAAPVRDVFSGGPEPGAVAGRAGHRAGPRQRADGIARRDRRSPQCGRRQGQFFRRPSAGHSHAGPCRKSRHKKMALPSAQGGASSSWTTTGTVRRASPCC